MVPADDKLLATARAFAWSFANAVRDVLPAQMTTLLEQTLATHFVDHPSVGPVFRAAAAELPDGSHDIFMLMRRPNRSATGSVFPAACGSVETFLGAFDFARMLSPPRERLHEIAMSLIAAFLAGAVRDVDRRSPQRQPRRRALRERRRLRDEAIHPVPSRERRLL